MLQLAALYSIALGLASGTARSSLDAPRPELGRDVLGAYLDDASPAHLAIALRLPDPAALRALLAAQQEPASRQYHRWLTPAEFGERFGVPARNEAALAAWLAAAGFAVTRYPNRLFLEATGTAGAVRRLLDVELREVRQEGGRRARTFEGTPTAPADLAPSILEVAGLDTRVTLRHHLMASSGAPSVGAHGLRAFYDFQPLLTAGHGANGLTLAVIGTQESSGPPATGDISYYYQNVSQASAQYVPDTLPNPNGDFDNQGANREYELDVEMQSVGAPNASAINLVLSPASEVFTTGLNYAANNLSNATVVSLSLGICEPNAQGEISAAQQYVQQGLAEGQSWFAASGDSGADDCRNGSGAAVDFPASLPEMVAVGGTGFRSAPQWDSNNQLDAYQGETTWNDGAGGGAGGGGASSQFQKPSWQQGVSPNDGARDLPDIALLGSPNPGVAVDTSGNAGELDPVGGTSVASPLAAGIFALVSERVGCRLGDIHAILYKLGQAQQNGGAQPFHDITSGNISYDGVTGPSAGPGFDLATGWGSLDVAALVAAWPSCNGSAPTGTSGGSQSTGGSGTASSSGGVGSNSGGSTSSGGGSTTGGSAAGSSTTGGSNVPFLPSGGSSGGSSSTATGGGSSGGSGSSRQQAGGQPASASGASGGETAGGPPPQPIPEQSVTGGCASATGPASFAWLLFGLGALGRRRRRRS